VANEYCAECQLEPVNKLESFLSSKLVLFATASGSCQSSYDADDFSSDDEECLMPDHVAETTPG